MREVDDILSTLKIKLDTLSSSGKSLLDWDIELSLPGIDGLPVRSSVDQFD